MALWLKQSTAVDVPIGPFVDATDGVTAETALTITQPDIRLKKNGGAWSQKNAAQTLSHEENGWYEVTLDATDTDTLGHLVVAVHESGALPVWCAFMVVPANVHDSLVGGSDLLNAEVAAMAANTLTAGAVASGAITAAKFGAGAIDAAALGADAGTELAAAVWASATRTLTANTNLNDPSAAAIADAVWDEAGADHLAAGSTGAKLNGAAAAGDPLSSTVPGDYASGSAGHALGRLGSGQVSIVAPVAVGGDVILVRGDDYRAVDGRALDFTDAAWPTLTDAAISLTAGTLAQAGSVVTPTGAGKTVRVELTAATTAALPQGARRFTLRATLANGDQVTLLQGRLIVKAD